MLSICCLCRSIPDNTQVELWLQEFDVDLDGTLSEHEFMTGIGKWAQKISKTKWSRKIQRLESNLHLADDPSFWAAQSSEAKKVLDKLSPLDFRVSCSSTYSAMLALEFVGPMAQF